MFKSLKEKLKGWVNKNEENEVDKEIVETKEEKKKKISKKTNRKDKSEVKATEKNKKKQKKISKKKSSNKEELSEIVEDVEDVVEDIEEQIDEVIENAKEIIDNKKTRSSIFKKILTEEKFNSMFEELEMILLTNNVAYDAVDKIKESLGKKLIGKSLKDINLNEELKNSIKNLLINPPNFIKTIKDSIKKNSPYVILFSGINGAGKTTTIAKVAYLLQKNKISVCLVAADTFRAAAIQQLEEHANKLKIPIIKKDYGVDPAAVAFDGIAYAKKHKINVVLIDTAGRIQNKDSLMKEIEKIARVAKADMKIFLGESITGNDATEQASRFNESINIEVIILSKADVDEKGGTAISVSAVTGKPILFLGIGQKYEDLEVFDKEKLIEKLGL